MQYPRKHTAEELEQNAVMCDHEWTITLTATSGPLPVVHYSGMKEQPLQTQRKIALLPKEVNRTKKKNKKKQYIIYTIRQMLSMYNGTLKVHTGCAVHV